MRLIDTACIDGAFVTGSGDALLEIVDQANEKPIGRPSRQSAVLLRADKIRDLPIEKYGAPISFTDFY